MLCARTSMLQPGFVLSIKAITRTISSAPFTLKTLKAPQQHCDTHCHAGVTVFPPGFPNASPLAHTVRFASTGSGVSGWYAGLADSSAVHLTEKVLVGCQQATGLPWWVSIMVTTVALRTLVTLPLGAYQMVIIGKVEALQSEIATLAKRLRYEVNVRAQERGWTEKHCRYQFRKNLRRIVSELYIRDNCHPVKASLLVWVQIPMWICVSLALRNLSLDQSAAHSALSTGGALWFGNLTLPDSSWLLPLCLGLTNLLIVEIFALQIVKVSKLQTFITNLIRCFSLIMIPIAATVPSSMALYWLSSSLIGLGHNVLLRSSAFHRLLKLPASSSMSYRSIAAAARDKYFR